MHDFDEKLNALIESAWREDVGAGDFSTESAIPADAQGKAVLKIKQDGILAGVDVAQKIFRLKADPSKFKVFKHDGDHMKAGEFAFEVEASVHSILACERIVLNCMQRMSGIATLTRAYADRISQYNSRILDTRKTTPNFRLLEKEAVRIGGGVNHRFGLYDMIMLKDNHIDYCGSIEKAIENAYVYVQQSNPGLKIEIETRSIAEVKRVIAVGRIDRIMLDNFIPEDVSIAVDLIGGKYETEASGGINLDNVEAYAKTGVDYISIGALIHQARSLDLSLKAAIV